jgi:glycosyltransferase involved in cell wall biosynthesis
MKILFISTHDYRGGAAKVAYNLCSEMNDRGVEAFMYVKYKTQNKPWIIESTTPFLIKKLQHLIDYLPMYLSTTKQPISFQFFGENLEGIIKKLKPDIINFHWTGKGFVSFKEVNKIAKIIPTVWTLHDQAFFQSGYFFENQNKELIFLTKLIEKNKLKHASQEIYFIAPSLYMKNLFSKNKFFKENRLFLINNGHKIMKNPEKDIIKTSLNINKNQKVILFGGVNFVSDKRKGFNFLKNLLKNESNFIEEKDIFFISFGNENPFEQLSIKAKNYRHLGFISDEKVTNQLFSLADIFILPSEMENFPTVAIEAITNGTPVLAFDTGGNKEIIKHKKTGYLAKINDINDFSYGFEYLLTNKVNIEKEEKNRFSLGTQTDDYLKLFKKIVDNYRSSSD